MQATNQVRHLCLGEIPPGRLRHRILASLGSLSHIRSGMFAQLFWNIAALLAAFIMVSCATQHATLTVTAPSAVTAGTPFTITVTTIYDGKPDTVINSYVLFASSDKAAVLPGPYLFTSTDAGSHTWPNGVTLQTPGNQTITATINMATGINGTAQISVSGP